MTPEALANLHAEAMPDGRGWTAADFADLLARPGCFLTVMHSPFSKYAGEREGPRPSHGATTQSAQNLAAFALGRVTLDEAELLTLAVDPGQHRKGLGQRCLAQFEAGARAQGASRAFLEVAASNQAARALYAAGGWTTDGTRPNYYATATGREDAILMSKALKTA